jgi:hypothetical protein
MLASSKMSQIIIHPSPNKQSIFQKDFCFSHRYLILFYRSESVFPSVLRRLRQSLHALGMDPAICG